MSVWHAEVSVASSKGEKTPQGNLKKREIKK